MVAHRILARIIHHRHHFQLIVPYPPSLVSIPIHYTHEMPRVTLIDGAHGATTGAPTAAAGSKRRHLSASRARAPIKRHHLLLVAAAAAAFTTATYADEGADTALPAKIIRNEELESKTGKDGGDIWLSILGDVFDVTTGRDYYAEGSGYSVFAGRDASPSFTTGNFTKEGSEQDLDELTAGQLVGVDGWRKFYADHETYRQIGVLCCDYYDEDGKPTEKLTTVWERLATHAAMKKEKERAKASAAAEKDL